MKSKVIALTVVLMMVVGVVSASSINGDYKGNPIVKIMSNGKQLEVDEVPGMILDGHTMVPISTLRQLGASVTWDTYSYSVDVNFDKSPALDPDPAPSVNLERFKAASKIKKDELAMIGITVSSYNIRIDGEGAYAVVPFKQSTWYSDEQKTNNIIEIASSMPTDLGLDGVIIELLTDDETTGYTKAIASVRINKKDILDYTSHKIDKAGLFSKWIIKSDGLY